MKHMKEKKNCEGGLEGEGCNLICTRHNTGIENPSLSLFLFSPFSRFFFLSLSLFLIILCFNIRESIICQKLLYIFSMIKKKLYEQQREEKKMSQLVVRVKMELADTTILEKEARNSWQRGNKDREEKYSFQRGKTGAREKKWNLKETRKKQAKKEGKRCQRKIED